MDFGITFKGDIEPEGTLRLAQMAEEAGFGYVWSFDSHVLWKECQLMLTYIGLNTRQVRLGPLVTNPVVRDLTVAASMFSTMNLLTGDRMEVGLGRGDSSRRVVGKKPTTLARTERFVRDFRALCAGEEIEYEGTPVQLTWTSGAVPPIWLAGYGPKALGFAGRHADGVVLQFADPHLIKWCLGWVRQGAAEAGRDFSQIKVMSCAPVWISDDLSQAREFVRWFPALVSNHVVDLLMRYPEDELPPELTTYVRTRVGYDYHHHAQVGSDNAAFVSDEIVDRYCIVGGVEEQIRRLEELRDLGVHQFNIYLMSTEEESQVEAYGRDIVPRLAERAPAS